MSRRSSPLDMTATLRQVRDPVIAVERAALVKKHETLSPSGDCGGWRRWDASDWPVRTGIERDAVPVS
ncbi:hypothetical protein FY145_10565 [Agrobacterium tumefaciens]|uniref:Uncharacterized protein n=1 Tax=Agrobacterium tumefaciens TaxID=358 RepID=A0AAP9J680_AGRTU|nr:hypothetical protein [Agrobacterium tumefaciens]NSZ58464.1 hypothetical protein [Agrobacterium tumefaciens]QDY94539.1 hypothetical protein CG010_010680 [Agrobacterium tumefaciens]UXS49666.1 hypothetical protein FY149_21010 [Agrobacterium tumefaciens]UXS70916.1 hypothetical protein FY146_10565 [Agrobacterium tumefaciens]UXS78579.1 hypothetical protein FY145_10565 [Agrobacterium tumefaciens]